MTCQWAEAVEPLNRCQWPTGSASGSLRRFDYVIQTSSCGREFNSETAILQLNSSHAMSASISGETAMMFPYLKKAIPAHRLRARLLLRPQAEAFKIFRNTVCKHIRSYLAHIVPLLHYQKLIFSTHWHRKNTPGSRTRSMDAVRTSRVWIQDLQQGTFCIKGH